MSTANPGGQVRRHGRQSGSRTSVDFVLHGGVIVTADPAMPMAQAVAVREDRIVAVGLDDEVMSVADSATTCIDLAGRTVVPGLNDSHHHFLNRAARAYYGVVLDRCGSVKDILAAVAEKVAQMPPGRTLVSNAGNAGELLVEGRCPTLAELDAVAPDHPLVLTFEDGKHVNSAMMRLSRVDRETASPAGGVIERDPITGALTGVFAGTARALIADTTSTAVGDAGTFSADELAEGVRWGQRQLNAIGITSLRNPALSRSDMLVYGKLRRDDELTVRIAMDLDIDHVNARLPDIAAELGQWKDRSLPDDAWLRLNGVGELWIDQSTDGMLLSEPYAELPSFARSTDYRGIQRVTAERLREVVLTVAALGWRPMIHAGGDVAIDLLLDAFEAADAVAPINGKRWLLDHAHYGKPRHIERVRNLGLVVAMQYHPYFCYPVFARLHGARRAAELFPAGPWIDAGLTVAGGSDHSRVPANLFEGLHFWSTRATRSWGTIGVQHAVNRQQALRMLTHNAAYLTFEETLKGTIRPGKLADLVVLSDDYLSVPDEMLPSLRALLTIVGGRIVHQDPEMDTDIPENLQR